MRPWRQEAWTRYLRGLAPLPNRVLDVGCGRRESLEIARAAGIAVAHGAEIVRSLCGPEVTLLPHGARELPFEDDSFDLVSAVDVLEHLEERDVGPALREATRVSHRLVFIGVPHKQDNLGLHLTVRDRDWWREAIERSAPHDARVSVVPLPIPTWKEPHSFLEVRLR